MRKALKFVGFLSATLALFFVVSSFAFFYLIRVGELRRFLIEEVEKNTDLKVQLGDAELEIGWVTGVVFRDVALALATDAEPALSAARVTARVALMPLLQRQVVIYEIRLLQPTAQIVRDKEGHIALLDKLFNLPFLKQQDSEFHLDLHSIRVQKGDIAYTDQQREDGVGTWRLVDADVNLDRVRGQRLRDFMNDLFRRQPTERDGQALEFAVRSTVLRDDAKMNLRARGHMVFPKEVLEFHEARWSADIELVNFPATLVKNRLAGTIPIKAMTGHLAQRVHVEGNPSEELRLKGDIEFRQLAADAPELFLAPLAGLDGRMSFTANWSPQRLQLSRVDFRTNEIKFSLQGDVGALDTKDPHFRLNLTGLTAPILVLRKYLPVKIFESPQIVNSVNSIQGGQVEIKNAGVNATLGQLRGLGQNGVGSEIWFDAVVHDLAGTVSAERSFSVRGIDGQVSLTKGFIAFRNVKGFYGDSRFTDIDGSYALSLEAKGTLDLKLKGDVNLTDLREQIRAGLFSTRAAKIAASLQDLAGRSKIDLALRRAVDAPLYFDGKIALENAAGRYDDYSLSEVQGEIAFTPSEIRAEKIKAQLSGSPVQIQLVLKDYDSEDGSFDLGLESSGLRAGLLTSLVLDTGTLKDPGTVRGAMRYSGSFNAKAPRKVVGDLDLLNVQVLIPPLLQPLRQLNGKIKIDESGVDFQNINASLVGFQASASGRWRYAEKNKLLFDFAAPNLDITYLISQIDPESSDFYANLVAEGKIAIGTGKIKNFEFSELKSNATIDHRVWRLTNVTARSVGGAIQGVTTIFDRPDTLGIAAEPKVQGVPVQSFLNWFDIANTEMSGNVNLTGKLETVGRNDVERKRNLNGAFNLRIEDGTINRMRVVVQILNLLDLSRWFSFQLPDLAKTGIRFRSITGDFKVTKGVYVTENLIVDSNDLRMTGAGKIDVPNDEVDFVVAVRPFAGIDTAMSYVPLLGRSIAAIKNSFLVASFNITGRIDDPTITPAPLGTLTEWFWGVLGIPKNMIGWGEGAKAEESKEPATPSPK